ncbi:Mononegavirales RNA-directed RNA polymerase catalytic domain [Cinara cedri]|uniref:Mononegavirales RNA-directed RNA polymerase catalytic domain n=1 Tax=Cinara cedri TaxID=506608 RepID=A0A5E4NCN2_9HEMI|nr:Mononegavirales RNA-directed RNA polymerase catalytic domain [Cinara cedri]
MPKSHTTNHTTPLLLFMIFDLLLVQLNKYEGYDLHQEVSECISQGAAYSQLYPVEVYDLMKMWPSICIDAVLRDVEGYNVFYEAIRPKISHPDHIFVQRMITPKLKTEDIHICLELSGLGKIFGHPIIDMEESISSWIGKGTVLKLDKRKMGRLCSQMFKFVLCRRYYEERNRWSPLEFDS